MRFLVVAALSALLLNACSSTGPVHEPAELESFKAEIKVKRLWGISMPSAATDEVYDRLQPVVVGDILYAATSGGDVRAFSIARKGKRIWKQDLDVTLTGGIGINDELLFVATDTAEVVALNRADGAVKWRAPVSSEAITAPVAASGYLFVLSGDGVLHALNSDQGGELWRLERPVPVLSLRGNAPPVVAGDKLLLGTGNGHLLAINVYNGRILWEASVASPKGRNDIERMVDVDAAPLVADDVVYAVAHQGQLVALSLESGRLLWSRDLGSASGIAIDHGYLYLVDDASQVWALDQRNGASLWKQDKLKYRQLTPPAVMDGKLVVGDFEGYLHWLSLEDGHLLGRYELDDTVRIAPIARQDGSAYFRTVDGDVDLLRLLKR